jgi:hypothetical protein
MLGALCAARLIPALDVFLEMKATNGWLIVGMVAACVMTVLVLVAVLPQ